MNIERIENLVYQLLQEIGEDPERSGLKETPARVAKMYQEIFEGTNYTNKQIAEMADKTFDEDIYDENCKDMVIVEDIPCFSWCEHHMALMNLQISVAYLPVGKVVGLSKIVRIAEMVSKRLQLQERIGSDIADIMTMITGSEDVAVVIKGIHSCMTARGVKKPGTVTKTSTLRGKFEIESDLRNELINLLPD
ncbi:GTP cyclohydrolase I FolE [Natranaerobius trueperi]|uniref:GTP cyclohydrolase 1 n=1 Tax=Natranaerobius trueperi TaxID=759412 RepID=A0A226BVJ9_9FIRM|nr:GTP cyclohydrolase I FolE [Natranaerobius trueperi]OWZ83016.1 GTP cyclohydrolase I FolE [Natranaerobius trueperi]